MMQYTNRYRCIAIFALFAVHSSSCTHHILYSLLYMGQLGTFPIQNVISFSHPWLIWRNWTSLPGNSPQTLSLIQYRVHWGWPYLLVTVYGLFWMDLAGSYMYPNQASYYQLHPASSTKLKLAFLLHHLPNLRHCTLPSSKFCLHNTRYIQSYIHPSTHFCGKFNYA